MITRDGEDRSFVTSGPVQEVSDQLEERFRKHLSLIEDPTEEVQDNNEETEQDIEEEAESDAKAAADRKAKADAKAKSGSKKAEPAKKVDPVKTALETVMEKLDKAAKASATKLIERIKKGTSDPDVRTFLANSLSTTFKAAVGDDDLVAKAMAEVSGSVVKDEPKKEEPAGMFEQPTPQPAPEPKAPEPVKVQQPAPVVTPPPAVQPAPQPAAVSMDIDDGDLF
jgi:hypothetical protein